jgi:hypothetical protein
MPLGSSVAPVIRAAADDGSCEVKARATSLCLLFLFAAGCGRDKGASQPPPAAAATAPDRSQIRFDDVTEKSGVAFVLKNGAQGRFHLIELMPGGVAAFDYDNDGCTDLYFTNGAALPSLEKTGPEFFNRLYRNDCHAGFTDVTERAGVSGAGYSMAVASGDFDNDGYRGPLRCRRQSQHPLQKPRGRHVRGRDRPGAGRRQPPTVRQIVVNRCRLVRCGRRWLAGSVRLELCGVGSSHRTPVRLAGGLPCIATRSNTKVVHISSIATIATGRSPTFRSPPESMRSREKAWE